MQKLTLRDESGPELGHKPSRLRGLLQAVLQVSFSLCEPHPHSQAFTGMGDSAQGAAFLPWGAALDHKEQGW